MQMQRPILILLLLTALACHKNAPITRSYRMGFQGSAPRPDINLYLQALAIWSTRADAAIISIQVPWDSLLNGEDPVAYVQYNFNSVVSYYRSRQLSLWVYIDPENGLDRTRDADDLSALGGSITQAADQLVYRRFVLVMDSLLKPDHLGLALETNLIRAAAPSAIYQGVKQAVNAAAADIKGVDGHVPLSVSVQAEVAWGLIGGTGYAGITQDRQDFPFLQEIGISSYPYISYKTPGDLPDDYYARIAGTTPCFVSEGGWTSAAIDANGQTIQSTPQAQAAYITRQGQLLRNAGAIGLFQLTFTDLELGGWPPQDQTGLEPFAFLGLVDSALAPKPALAAWDTLFQEPRAQ